MKDHCENMINAKYQEVGSTNSYEIPNSWLVAQVSL